MPLDEMLEASKHLTEYNRQVKAEIDKQRN